MTGYIDLHCHPLPGIDDGAPTAEAGARLLADLHAIGFAHVVATPHVRCPQWDNTPESVAPAVAQLKEALRALEAAGTPLPRWSVSAEHYLDDIVWERFSADRGMLHPGGRAALFELPYDALPFRVELRLFKLTRKKITPLLAHPERCTPLQQDIDKLRDLIGAGAVPVLDLMSLVGAYGSRAQRAAEAMLEAKLYRAACSDAHKPADVPTVAASIERLERLVGASQRSELLSSAPLRLTEERMS